jgi:hypothetical protein
MKNVKQYYKELGKLAYAIAIADGVVQPEERDKLHQMVTKELAFNERTYDSSGMNQAFYVDFEFDELERSRPGLNGTVKTFNHFLETNVEPGDEALISRSLNLMIKVANAYSKKREKNIIEQVKQSAGLFFSRKV